MSTSNFVEDYDVDLTPVASPEPFGMSEWGPRPRNRKRSQECKGRREKSVQGTICVQNTPS